MDLAIDVEKLLASKRSQVVDGGTNTIEVFRANFMAFEQMIEFYKKNRKFGFEVEETAYGEIRKLLTAKGIVSKGGDLTNNTIGSYMSQVRAEQSKKAVKTRPLDADHRPVGARSAPSHLVAPAPVPKASVAAPAVLGVVPVPVTDWLNELKRLEADPGAEWSGRDQWMWDEMEKVAKSYGKNLARDFVSVEGNLDGVKVHCLRVLLNKRP